MFDMEEKLEMDLLKKFLKNIIYADIEILTEGLIIRNEDRKVSYIVSENVLYLYSGAFQMEVHGKDIQEFIVNNKVCELILKNNLKIFIKKA